MDGSVKKSLRGLDKYSRDVWGQFLNSELSSIHGKRVLDLGCGNRRYTSGLINYNNVIGVDINGNSDVDVIASAENLPFRSGSFDEVIAIGLLDYSNPTKTLDEIYRVLVKGGIARIMVPNYLNPYVMLSTSFGPYRKVKSAFTDRQLDTLFYRNGFDIECTVIRGFCCWFPSKLLQEVFIPVFKYIDRLTYGRFGNNIYMVIRKV